MATQAVGDLLRHWRQERGKSQLDLSLDAAVSQRHVSFVESGRSVPSRELLMRLAQTLDVPLRERNLLLLAAGYAPIYSEGALGAEEMTLVRRAVVRMLDQQEPHPGLVLDRYWNVVANNQAAPRLFGSLMDLETWPRPRNLLHLMLSPKGLRPHIADWEQVAAGLLSRVEREAIGHRVDAQMQALLEQVRAYPGVRGLGAVRPSESPVLPITFVKGKERRSYFSLVTTVGVPQSIAAQELRVECMYPVEDA